MPASLSRTLGICKTVLVFPRFNTLPLFFHMMERGGSPVASHSKFILSPSSTSTVAFGFVMIFGGTDDELKGITYQFK